MDWWQTLSLIIGSVVATGVVTAFGASWALSRKVNDLAAATEVRVKDYEKWRTQIETRLDARAAHLEAHERECRERWEKQVREQGRVGEMLRSIDEQLKGRTDRWEKLLEEHGGVMERLRSIDTQLQNRPRRH